MAPVGISSGMKVFIISRSFWPENPVLGNALLSLSEKLAERGFNTFVFFQSRNAISDALSGTGRGSNVNLLRLKSRTNQRNAISLRILEYLFFSVSVLFHLMVQKPQFVYVSSDPPILVPLIVSFYAKLFRAKYIYHLQDIHPESANIVLHLNKNIFLLLNLRIR